MVQSGYRCEGPLTICPHGGFICLGAGAALHDEEEVMEQEPPVGEREGDGNTEEVDLPVSSPQNSTDSDRQMGEEDEAEWSDKPTGKPADGTAVRHIEGHPPDNELAERHPPNDELAEGHPPDDELAEGHPPNDELTEDHPPNDELVETITVECPPSGRECSSA